MKMNSMKKVLAAVLAVLIVGPFAPLPASAYQSQSILSQQELDALLAESHVKDERARADIQSVLQRDDVREIAARVGVEDELQQAMAGIHTLSGSELETLHANALDLEQQLEGGERVTISLISLLLIVIIVILLAG